MTKDENLEGPNTRLGIIWRLVQAERLRDPHTEVIIAGDFNRHSQLWEWSHINSTASQGQSEPIIELIAELSLQSLLQTGVTTFVSDAGRSSTTDLMLVTPGLTSDLAKCVLWKREYGSDHRAIQIIFCIDMDRQESKERLIFKDAPWDKIREAVQQG